MNLRPHDHGHVGFFQSLNVFHAVLLKAPYPTASYPSVKGCGSSALSPRGGPHGFCPNAEQRRTISFPLDGTPAQPSGILSSIPLREEFLTVSLPEPATVSVLRCFPEGGVIVLEVL
jgi:hypothetical protein